MQKNDDGNSFNPNFEDSAEGEGPSEDMGAGLSLADIGNQIGNMAGDFKKMKKEREARPSVPKHTVAPPPNKPKAPKEEETDPLEDPVLLRARAMIAAAAEMSVAVNDQISKIGQHRSPPPKPKTPSKKHKPKKHRSPRQDRYQYQPPRQDRDQYQPAPPPTFQPQHSKKNCGTSTVDAIPSDGQYTPEKSVHHLETERGNGGNAQLDARVVHSQKHELGQQFKEVEISPVEAKRSPKRRPEDVIAQNNADFERTISRFEEGSDSERYTAVSVSEQGSPRVHHVDIVDWRGTDFRRAQSGSSLDAAEKAKLRVARKRKEDKLRKKAEMDARSQLPPEDLEEKARRVAASQLRAKQRAKAKKKEAQRALTERLKKEQEEREQALKQGHIKAEELRREAARRAAKQQALKRRKAQLEKLEKEVEQEERQKRLAQVHSERAKKPTSAERRLRKETQDRIRRNQRQQERLKQKEDEKLKQQIQERIMANIELHERQTESLRDPKRESRVNRNPKTTSSDDIGDAYFDDENSYFPYEPTFEVSPENRVPESPARGSGLKAIRKQWNPGPSNLVVPVMIAEESDEDNRDDNNHPFDVSPLTSPAHHYQMDHSSPGKGLLLPSIYPLNPHQAHVELESDNGCVKLENETNSKQAPPPPPVKATQKKKGKKKVPVWKQKPIEIKPYKPIPKSDGEFRR